ncbi:hypothetical protein [Mycoplasmopsis felis]|uniref:hypothetical protein n=1 Tax=Mycoplasmopsis felis TaxID=33923 RepID=UPI002AF6AA82|nr:hypothetical protein [Mycoplasmopsis felis]WQQ02058.1 hypothetical protein RRG54_01735 [Mycoplasmopsis felis]WQQ03544.1 hypothetical protein RRG38_01660 [Mycoplasmopsis felis]WQQ07470.1 hypothetical protein RRG57_02420 [Mycoplasmopsis felis]WRX07025.1 hypothetical protein O7984_02005 [Mycoplasmopsis felis]
MIKFQKKYEIIFWTLWIFFCVLFGLVSLEHNGAFFGFAIGSLCSYILFKITLILTFNNSKNKLFVYFLNILKMFIFFIFILTIIYLILKINNLYTKNNLNYPINFFYYLGGINLNLIVILIHYLLEIKGGKIGRNKK